VSARSDRPSILPRVLGRQGCIRLNGFPKDAFLAKPLSPQHDELERYHDVFGQPLTDHEIRETCHRIIDREKTQAMREDKV
jgi:hypothetical protein